MERTQFPGGTFTRSRPAPFHGARDMEIYVNFAARLESPEFRVLTPSQRAVPKIREIAKTKLRMRRLVGECRQVIALWVVVAIDHDLRVVNLKHVIGRWVIG